MTENKSDKLVIVLLALVLSGTVWLIFRLDFIEQYSYKPAEYSATWEGPILLNCDKNYKGAGFPIQEKRANNLQEDSSGCLGEQSYFVMGLNVLAAAIIGIVTTILIARKLSKRK